MQVEKMVLSKKGFTLVELIVVIAIIGILAAVITPMFVNQVKESRVATDQANAKTIENSILRAVAKGTLELPLTDSAATLAVIGSELTPLPTCEVEGNKFVVNKTTGRLTTKAEVDAATEFELVP